MSYRIDDIEGIGVVYAQRLVAAAVRTTAELLDAAATPQGREQLAKRTGLSHGQVLKWANLADLMRISGIGPEFSELLEAAGVDTVAELKQRNPDHLAEAMAAVNETRKLTRAVPSSKVVRKWVDQAQVLPPCLSY